MIIPEAVFEEIVIRGAGQPGSAEVQTADWIETRRAQNRTAVAALRIEVDAGEAEAIALAAELRADLLLLDERKGRAIAARLSIHVMGLLGVLVEAKHRGLIHAIKPIVDDLVRKAGFRVSQELYARVLQAAGE